MRYLVVFLPALAAAIPLLAPRQDTADPPPATAAPAPGSVTLKGSTFSGPTCGRYTVAALSNSLSGLAVAFDPAMVGSLSDSAEPSPAACTATITLDLSGLPAGWQLTIGEGLSTGHMMAGSGAAVRWRTAVEVGGEEVMDIATTVQGGGAWAEPGQEVKISQTVPADRLVWSACSSAPADGAGEGEKTDKTLTVVVDVDVDFPETGGEAKVNFKKPMAQWLGIMWREC